MSYQIPSTYTRVIARVLRLSERRLPQLLEGTGLSLHVFNPGDDSHVTGEQQLLIMKNARRLSTSPDLGLRIGQMLEPASHGALGYLVLSSPDLKSALLSLSEYLPIRLPWTSIDVRSDDTWLDYELRLNMDMDDEPLVAQMINEGFAMLMQSFCEQMLGREIPEAEIHLTHSAPDYDAAYGEYLHASLHFGASKSIYRLPRTLENAPNIVADPLAVGVAKGLCDDLLQQTQDHAASSTAEKVRTLLLLKPFATTTEKDVADALYLSRRTLARRLDSEGTSYRSVRDQVLSDLSIRWLRESTQSVESIATTLGYSDSAAFRKAFRRWTGKTPSSFRGQPVDFPRADGFAL